MDLQRVAFDRPHLHMNSSETVICSTELQHPNVVIPVLVTGIQSGDFMHLWLWIAGTSPATTNEKNDESQ